MRVSRTIAVGPIPVGRGSVHSDTINCGRTQSCAVRDGQVWSDTVHNVNLYINWRVSVCVFVASFETFGSGSFGGPVVV